MLASSSEYSVATATTTALGYTRTELNTPPIVCPQNVGRHADLPAQWLINMAMPALTMALTGLLHMEMYTAR